MIPKSENVYVFVTTATDVAGEVLDVGPGVKNFKIGDKVVSMLNTFVSFSQLLLIGVHLCEIGIY